MKIWTTNFELLNYVIRSKDENHVSNNKKLLSNGFGTSNLAHYKEEKTLKICGVDLHSTQKASWLQIRRAYLNVLNKLEAIESDPEYRHAVC